MGTLPLCATLYTANSTTMSFFESYSQTPQIAHGPSRKVSITFPCLNDDMDGVFFSVY